MIEYIKYLKNVAEKSSQLALKLKSSFPYSYWHIHECQLKYVLLQKESFS